MAETISIIEHVRISFSNHRYDSLFELFHTFNAHVESQEYAVIKARIKKSKKDVIRKCVFRYNREKKFKNSDTDKRIHTSFRLIDCLYNAIVILKNDF